MAKTREQAIAALRAHIASRAEADGFLKQDDAAMWELREETAIFDANAAGLSAAKIDQILEQRLQVWPSDPPSLVA